MKLYKYFTYMQNERMNIVVKKFDLALYGGPKAKTEPYDMGKRFGSEELEQLQEALEQNTLFYWHGKKSKELFDRFAGMYGQKYCTGASSGTAAIHCALAASGVTAGDEVITSPITDMGSVIGILLQNAIPVFADLEPYTYNLSPASVADKITERTKAVLVVHLAGNPADMDAINAAAKPKGIAVIEDCAQSYLSYYKGKLAGTLGDIGCFSLNDFKHISAGDGGLCITDIEQYYHRLLRFADKNYDRLGLSLRSVDSLAPNYRINELTSAVAIAQLGKLEFICSSRNRYGDALTAAFRGLPGIRVPEITYEGSRSSYWFYMLRIDEEEARMTRTEFCEALRAEGIPASEGYIPTCVYEYDLFTGKNAYPGTHCPFDCPKYGAPEKNYVYGKGLCPTAEQILQTAVRLNVNEFYTETDLAETIAAVQKVCGYFYNR